MAEDVVMKLLLYLTLPSSFSATLVSASEYLFLKEMLWNINHPGKK